jgi:protein-S-isoprenylcysteine O-methyltransferase Ste14
MLMLITLVHFKTSLRFGMSSSNKGDLITTGIFSFSRNPFFLSLNLYFTGQAMVFPAIVFIGFALMAVAGIHFFILKEEKFLIIFYGESYTSYQKKVRRYF